MIGHLGNRAIVDLGGEQRLLRDGDVVRTSSGSWTVKIGPSSVTLASGAEAFTYELNRFIAVDRGGGAGAGVAK